MNIIASICIVVILILINRRIDRLPKWEITDSKTVEIYNQLKDAGITIAEQRKRIKKLELALSIKEMNDSLEKDDGLWGRRPFKN